MSVGKNPTGALRILHFLGVAGAGGTELIVHELIRSADPSLLRQDVLVLTERGPMSERFERLGVGVKHLNWSERRNKAGILADVRRELRKGGYDLVIAYGIRANMLSRLAAAGLGVKAAGGLRSIYGSDIPKRWHDLADRVTFPLSVGYISNSRKAIERYTGMGFNPKKFHLLYDGIDTEKFSPDRRDSAAARDELGVAKNSFVMTSVANLRPVKNHSMQLRALRLLLDEKIAATLLLAGEGPLKEALQAEAARIGVAEHARFLGRRDDVPIIIAASDAFLLSSKWEGIPDSILEAMAAGLPVVTTDVGCIGEAVSDGMEGFLIPPEDDATMAGRLAQLARDPELGKEMGKKGRERAVEQFSLGKMLDGFHECCLKMVRGA